MVLAVIYKNIGELIADDLKWRKIAYKVSKCKIQADELVNEFYENYLKLKPPSINSGYVFMALSYNYIKEYKKYSFVELNESIEAPDDECYDIESDNNLHKLYNKLIHTVDCLEIFDKLIFKYVMLDGMSIRQLAKESGIHYNIIQQSMKKTKELLHKKYINEYGRIRKT